MTLPARRHGPDTAFAARRNRADEKELADRLRQRIAVAEKAARAAGAAAGTQPPPPIERRRGPVGSGTMVLACSCLALAASVGMLGYETFGPPAAQDTAIGDAPAPLVFSGVSSRYVQSAEGPALELSGIVRNQDAQPRAPAVTLKLSGSRVAIEERLALGSVPLSPGAERPFAVRLLLPEGARTVSLLPASKGGEPAPSMVLVSPAWTAETPGY